MHVTHISTLTEKSKNCSSIISYAIDLQFEQTLNLWLDETWRGIHES